MNPILKQIIQQTGVSCFGMYSDRDAEELLLVYDAECKICIGPERNLRQEEYISKAWSCDALCYLSFDEQNIRINGLGFNNGDIYPIDVILSNIIQFIDYLRKYAGYKPYSVYTYLLNRCHSISDVQAVSDEKHIVDGLEISLDVDLLKRHILPSSADVLAIISNSDEDIEKRTASVLQRGFKNVRSFYTPNHQIAHTIQGQLSDLKQKESITILDPMTWGVSNIVEIIRELSRINYQGEIKVISWSILPSAPQIFEELLRLYDIQDITVDCKLAFTDEEWPMADVLLLQPPYRMLVDLVGEINKDEEMAANLMSKDVDDLTHKLIGVAITHLKQDGVMLLNIPSYMLEIEKFRSLRNDLAGALSLGSIQKMGRYTNNESLGDMCSVALHNTTGRNQTARILWCDDNPNGLDESIREDNKKQMGALIVNADIASYRLPVSVIFEGSWVPKPYSGSEILEHISYAKSRGNKLMPLESLFRITTGVRTGYNKAYIIDNFVYEQLEESERLYYAPVVSGSNIHHGMLEQDRYIFFPYLEGLEPIPSESYMKNNLPHIYKLMIPYKLMIQEGRSSVKKNKWWDYVLWRPVHKPGTPKIVSATVGAKGSFAVDYEGSHVPTSAYLWIPKRKTMQTQTYLYAYMALFNSDYFWKVVSLYCKPMIQYGKTSYRITKQALQSIPIPDLSESKYDEILYHLAEKGTQISRQGCYNDADLEGLIENVYYGVI